MDMPQYLEMVPLRSLVAIADEGGFQRAADALHLSQGAVSQHLRRLEAAAGRPLVERHGRGSRFTADGERLVGQARRILALHDEALDDFRDAPTATLTIGTTEHAAAQLLPRLAEALERTAPGLVVRFRVDRGLRLRKHLADGTIDLALLSDAGTEPRSTQVGELALTWYAAPGWTRPPAGEPVPLVAFDDPCALRTRALQTLAEHAVPAVVGTEASQLAGVQAAVGAGQGVALMATLGDTPARLVVVEDLPVAEPLPLFVCAARALDPGTARLAASALQEILTGDVALTLVGA